MSQPAQEIVTGVCIAMEFGDLPRDEEMPSGSALLDKAMMIRIKIS